LQAVDADADDAGTPSDEMGTMSETELPADDVYTVLSLRDGMAVAWLPHVLECHPESEDEITLTGRLSVDAMTHKGAKWSQGIYQPIALRPPGLGCNHSADVAKLPKDPLCARTSMTKSLVHLSQSAYNAQLLYTHPGGDSAPNQLAHLAPFIQHLLFGNTRGETLLTMQRKPAVEYIFGDCPRGTQLRNGKKAQVLLDIMCVSPHPQPYPSSPT
tara:strand:- start:12 stop:656 length:645 start_codon:yes stop_codon:yes gene_type:complete